MTCLQVSLKDTQIHSQLLLSWVDLRDTKEDIHALRQMFEARQEVEAVLVKLTDPLTPFWLSQTKGKGYI